MPTISPLPFGPWVAACSLAEAIGMTAAATASQLASATDDRWLALATIVAGGLMEGVALGALQAAVLGRWLPRLHTYAWVVVTAAVAGLGWAAASARSQFGGTDRIQPVLGVVLLGAVALGAVMGAVLGAAQFLVLRGAVPRPARWIAVSALAWAPAMAIIFVGATAPDASWSTLGIVAVAATTGALAGAVLGAISGALSPWLAGRSASNQIILGILRSRWHRAIDRNIIVLRMLGRRTGRTLELPVQYVTLGDRLVIYPHAAQRKNWWRNLIDPVSLEVLVRGRWTSATGHVVTGGDPSWELARSAYIGRWPRITIAKDAPLAVVELTAAPSTHDSGMLAFPCLSAVVPGRKSAEGDHGDAVGGLGNHHGHERSVGKSPSCPSRCTAQGG